MSLSRSLLSLAILKVNWDEKRYDYIENFVPFIASLIHKRKYDDIKVETVCKDFSDEYGLNIPHEPMTSILVRCKHRGLIKRAGHLHLPIWEEIVKRDFSAQSQTIQREIEAVIKDIRAQVKSVLGKDLEADDISAIIIDFLKDHDGEILFAAHGISLLPDVKSSKSEKFVVFKYIQSCLASDPEKCKYIINIALGHILANTIMYGKDLTRFQGKLNKLSAFIDIKFLLRLAGVEGEQRKITVTEFIEGILEKGASIKVFEHTYDETIGILNGAKNWLQNRAYNPLRATPATRYFVENNLDESDVDLCITKMRSALFKYNIQVELSPDPLKNPQFVVDENTLNDRIVEVYKKHNPFFNEEEKEFTIQKDIKSISSIYILRKRNKPQYIRDVRFLFVTANTSLAFAASVFERENIKNLFTIPVAVTNVFLGTNIWLDNPAKFESFNVKKIIADCLAAISPNDKTIKKYIVQIEKLAKDGIISDDEYYFLRTYRTSYQVLEEITYGDEDNFNEKTPQEILRILREEGKLESQKELEEERAKNIETRENLDDTLEQLENTKQKIDHLSKRLAGIVSWAIFIALCIGLVALLLFEIFKGPNIGIRIALAIITLLGTGYGLTFKTIRKRIYNSLYHRVKDYFLKN